MSRLVAVSGAYGYLGSIIRSGLERDGWETIALVRSPRPSDRAIRWTLGETPTCAALTECQAMVHCAYDFGCRTRGEIWHTNVTGSALLIAAAERSGVSRIVSVSSMSAYAGTRQLYGQAKLEIERLTLAAGGVVLRPGLVYGDNAAGVVGILTRLTKLRILPVFAGAYQYPVRDVDVVDALVRLLDSTQWESAVVGIAEPKPVEFRELLRRLAAQQGRRCVYVPIPWRVLYALLRAAEMLGLRLPLRADSLLGVVRPAPFVPTAPVAAEIAGDPPSGA